MVYLLVEDQRFLFHLEDPFDSANHQNIFLKICAFIQLALLIRKKKILIWGTPRFFQPHFSCYYKRQFSLLQYESLKFTSLYLVIFISRHFFFDEKPQSLNTN